MMSIFYIKCERKIGLIFTTALGLFASLWTNCVFVICIKKNMYTYPFDKEPVTYEYDLILRTIQYEYLLIVGITIMSLFWGIKRGCAAYFLPWACLKICECVTLFFGIPLLITMSQYDGLIPFALLSLGLNIYTSICIRRVYRKLETRTPYENQINEQEHQDVENIPPPSYEIAIQPEAVVVESVSMQAEQSTEQISTNEVSREEISANETSRAEAIRNS